MFQETMRTSSLVATVADRRKRRSTWKDDQSLPAAAGVVRATRTGQRPSLQNHNSISTPGGGTMISLSGSAAAAEARTHSTAGPSPCTSTTFFGATFVM